MFIIRSRATALVWRQAADPFVASTIKPKRHFELRLNGRILSSQSLASSGTQAGDMTPAAGAATVSFSGAAISAATLAAAVGAASVSLAGSSIAAGTVTAAAGEATASLTGSAIGAGSVLAAGSSTAQFTSGDAAFMVPAAGSATATFTGAALAAGDLTPAAGTSTASMVGESVAAASMTTAVGQAVASFIGEAVEQGGGGANPAAVWAYVLSNGKTAGQTMVETHAMLSELYRIHGLAAGEPLVVDKTTRTAGDIEQSITQVGDVVTVTRTG